MSSARNGAANQRRILRSICSCFPRAFGFFSSMAKRRSDCNTRLRLVVRLCSCSPAKEAEYFTTHRYSHPWTRVFSAVALTPVLIQHARDARQRHGKLFAVRHVSGIHVMTEAQAMLAIQHVAQTDLPQVMAALLVVSPLGQLIPAVATGDVGVEVGGVVGQQTTTHQLLLFP